MNAALADLILDAGPDFSGPTFVDVYVEDGPHAVGARLPGTVEPAPPQIALPDGLVLPPWRTSPTPRRRDIGGAWRSSSR